MSEKTEVNLSGVKQSQGVWLVKVPKYLSQQWDKATEKGDVGKISIGKKQGKTEVRFSLNEELTVLGAVGEKDASLQVPKDHPFTMHTVGGQTMAVFSQSDTDEISLEGMVVHRAECRPVVNDNYMKLKNSTETPSGGLRRWSSTAPAYLLSSGGKPNDTNRCRNERSKQVKLRSKAGCETYLKEIMKEIGTYNNKGAHKSTWELKPEYRHYQSAEEEEEMQTT
ncbi:General transcription factor IIF subunit 2 [Larimichthys crocea]|uniref:Uncharacterized protein n=1 Tax=Larimichthys crocea TaxID=215358 RepID=A0ACD3QHI3_LARCR|nr:General transcription factor IIF subunit 2 [Larimichthys crocea]